MRRNNYVGILTSRFFINSVAVCKETILIRLLILYPFPSNNKNSEDRIVLSIVGAVSVMFSIVHKLQQTEAKNQLIDVT